MKKNQNNNKMEKPPSGEKGDAGTADEDLVKRMVILDENNVAYGYETLTYIIGKQSY